MSRFRCDCGHLIVDITDFLPYKARFIRDEDSQLPTTLLANAVVGLLQARQQGTERDFLVDFNLRYSGDTPETAAAWVDRHSAPMKLESVLEEMIFSFWWGRYEDAIYECKNCGCMWFETDDGLLASYVPEGSKRGILQSRHHHPPYPQE